MDAFCSTFKSPQDSCDEVLQVLRDSSLHFLVSETPYSIQICIRKRFLKDAVHKQKNSDDNVAFKIESIQKKNEALVIENSYLINDLEEANKALENSQSTNNILHEKIEKAEKELFKYFSEKKDFEKKTKEIKMKLDEDNGRHKSQIKALNKSEKSKDKELFDLGKKFDNASDTNKNLKMKNSKLEVQIKKLEKKLAKKVPFSVKTTQTSDNSDENHNPILIDLPSAPSSSTMSSDLVNSFSYSMVYQMSPKKDPKKKLPPNIAITPSVKDRARNFSEANLSPEEKASKHTKMEQFEELKNLIEKQGQKMDNLIEKQGDKMVK